MTPNQHVTNLIAEQEKRHLVALIKLRLAHAHRRLPLPGSARRASKVEVRHDQHSIWLAVKGEAVARLDWACWWERDLETRLAHAVWITDRLVRQWVGAATCERSDRATRLPAARERRAIEVAGRLLRGWGI